MEMLRNLGLMILAILLSSTLIIGALSAVVISIVRYKGVSFLRFWADLFLSIAIAIDIVGNVVLGPLFNVWFIKRSGYKYGNPLDTISIATAVNYKRGTLIRPGQRFMFFIEFFDPGHTEKSYKSWFKRTYGNVE